MPDLGDGGFGGFGSGLEDPTSEGGAADGSASSGAPSASPFTFGGGLFNRGQMFANRPQMDAQNPIADRVNSLATARQGLQRSLNNPLRAFLKPQEYRQDAAAAADLDQKLFQTQQAVQDVQAERQQAYNGGLRPETLNTLPVNATAKTIFNAWVGDYQSGSWNSMKYLSTLGDVGKGAMSEQEGNFMPALDARNTQAQDIVDQLTTAAQSGQPQYAAVLAKMKQDGVDPSKVLGDYVPNFAVPDKADAWNVRGRGVVAQLAQAKQVVSKYNQAQAGLGQYDAVSDEKVASAVQGSMFKGSQSINKDGSIEGGSTIKLPNNEYGSALPSGSAGNISVDKYGKEFSNATGDNVKAFNEQLNEKQTAGATEQFKKAKQFRDVAFDPKSYTTAAGVTMIVDKFSGVARSVAENSNAAGNVGLAKLFHTNVGNLGEAIDSASKNYSDVTAWISAHSKGATINDSGEVVDRTGKVVQNAPRLSTNTMQGIKAVANFEYDHALSEAKERIGGPLFAAGRIGMQLDRTGLDATLQNDPALMANYQAGKQSYVRDVQSHPYVTIGDQHVMLRQDSANPLAKKFAPLKENDGTPTDIQPRGGAVLVPQSGDTRDRAQMELHYAKAQNAGVATTPKPPTDPSSPIQPALTPNGMNLLRTIRGSESKGDDPNSYSMIVGGKSAQTYDDHPGNINPKIGVDTKNGHSTAAGAYQFTKTTWNETAAKYGNLLDRDKNGNVSFTPQNQDKAAWLLAQDRYNKVTGGSLEKDLSDPAKHDQVLKALSGTWTSLPGGSEPNRATASRKGFLGRLSALYTAPGQTALTGNVNNVQPEFNPDVQKARAGSGELPATGSTMGALAGSIGGVPGAMVGGAIGGGGGQMVQNAATGKPLTEGVGREAGLGAVQGIVPGSRQVLGAMARSVGAGGVAATEEALTNPDATAGSVALEGAKTGAAALAGEGAFGIVGLALGRTGQLYNKFTDATKVQLNEAGAVIAKGKPEAPKSAGTVPVSESAKAAHEADLKAYDEAVQTAKDHGLDPEDLAHAVLQVPAGKVAVDKVVAAQKGDLSARYQEIRNDVGLQDQANQLATGVKTKPKQAPLNDGPVSLVGKHADVPQEYMGRAVQAENNIIAPAKNWQEKYQQVFQERSKLLTEYREALPNGDAPNANKAAALKAIADNVGDQQRALLRHVYGAKGDVMANKLDALHRDYAEFMGATKGGDIIENMAKPGQQGAAATAAFNRYAKDDKGAQQIAATLANAIRNPKSDGGRNVKFIASAVMGALGLHAAPALVLATEGPKMLSDWAIKRAAGAPVTMKALLTQKLRQQVSRDKGRASAAFGRGAAQAEMTQ